MLENNNYVPVFAPPFGRRPNYNLPYDADQKMVHFNVDAGQNMAQYNVDRAQNVAHYNVDAGQKTAHYNPDGDQKKQSSKYPFKYQSYQKFHLWVSNIPIVSYLGTKQMKCHLSHLIAKHSTSFTFRYQIYQEFYL